MCKTERLKSTLNKAGVCPFCVDKPQPAPQPEPPLKKSYAKRTTKVKPAAAAPAPAAPSPEPAAKTAIDPDKEREEVREQVTAMLSMSYDPPAYVQAKTPQQELAQRELCKRKLLPFIQRFRPKYVAGWVHADICRRLERFKKQVELGQSPRLLLMCPPRSGKSEIGSRHFAPWVLGDHPDWEIIAASHTSSLTMSFSRYIRDLMRDPAYHVLYPDTKLDPGSQSVENWNTPKGGGYLAAGVGTGITGRGCLAAYTLVDTDRGKIRIIDLKVGDSVYGYDHKREKVVATRVKALQITERSKPLLDCGDIRLTTDHRIYNASTGNYASAGEQPNLLGLRREESSACGNVQSVLFQSSDGRDHDAQMRLLWEELFAQRSGVPEVAGQARRSGAGVLQPSLLRPVQAEQPCGVQQGEGRVLALQEAGDRDGSFQVLQHGVLQRVQGFETTDGCVQWRISDAKEANAATRQKMFAVWHDEGEIRCAPYQSGRNRRPDFESGAALHGVPPQISSVHGACAADIAKLFAPFDFVVDIQTETGNFFTEGLLVHNCHILLLDDLVKDIEAADSDTISENTWQWYASTAYTRLAPGGGVLGIMTWWSENDWAGRIQQVMKTGEGDTFEIVRYPAINDEGDEYLLPDDSIVQVAPRSKVPEGAKMTRPMNTAVHPARYNTEAMLRIKNNLVASGQKRIWQALYQQNPTPDDGLHFTKNMFKKVPYKPNLNECRIYQAWDFAITENNDSDYTVGSTIAQDFEDNLFVLDVIRFRSSDSIYIVDTILDYWDQWNCDFLGFEDGQIWKTMEAQFEKRTQERKMYPSWELLKPLTDKLVRAHPLKGRMQAGKVYFCIGGDWFEECERELLRFPGGKHDDQVDSLAWNVRLTLMNAAPKDPRPKPKMPESWKTRLAAQLSGGKGGYMSS